MNTTTNGTTNGTNLDNLLTQVDMSAPVRGQTVDARGLKRSQEDHDAAVAAGFAPAQTLYARGTMVVDLGVENFRRSRQEFDAMPTVTSACADFQRHVAGEHRHDIIVKAGSTRMAKSGRLQFRAVKDGAESKDPGIVSLTIPALKDLCSRGGWGGGSYLAHKCDPELRAINANRQLAKVEAEDLAAMAAAQQLHRERSAAGSREQTEFPAPRMLKLRTRKSTDGRNSRECFAVVTPSYTPFDVDQIARALALAMPEGARCTVDYDGERAKFNVVFHSDVSPEGAVCGEFFKAGITFRTDDTGSGSITGYATIFQNLCLNLIIIDEAKSATVKIRHVGDVNKLAAKFRAACEGLKGQLSHFIERWGFARKDDVTAATLAAMPAEEAKALDCDDVFPGIFRALIEQEVLAVKGDSESIIDALLKCHAEDESSATSETRYSRAAVANAITRYAHTVNQDPFAEDALQVAAGEILFSDKPLPYAAKGGK